VGVRLLGTGNVIFGSKNVTVEELKGKNWVEGLNTHIFVLQTLAKTNLNENDVQFVNIVSQEMVTLDTKQVDSGHNLRKTTLLKSPNP
jgi:ABC-type nitrate/sulfonate/bicarbonate transport system substrate-binding protein